MKCQRTGWCCIGLEVIVVLKENSSLGLYSKPTGVRCPNLRFDPETQKASCGVHGEPWYEQTPCFVYQNSEIDPDYVFRAGQPCSLGPHMAKHHSLPVYGEPPGELRRLADFEPEESV